MGMLTNEASQRPRKAAKLPADMARPRTRPIGAKTVLSFQVEDSLVEALDAAAEEMTHARPVGSTKVTRSEVVKVALSKWLADRSAKPTRQ